MLRPGSRILILTGRGELPGRVVNPHGIGDGRPMVLCPPFYFGQFLAWRADMRLPMDFAADEVVGFVWGSLCTSRPAWNGRGDPRAPGMPVPRRMNGGRRNVEDEWL
jgi:hypothetical protein